MEAGGATRPPPAPPSPEDQEEEEGAAPRGRQYRDGDNDDNGAQGDSGEDEDGRGLARRWLRALWALLALALALLLGCARRCARAWRRLRGDGAGDGGDGDGEVARLLALARVPAEERDPFEVLGAAAAAPDAELRRAYRRLAVTVHPDKNKHPRAAEAFRVLRAAWDAVSSPERRKEHEIPPGRPQQAPGAERAHAFRGRVPAAAAGRAARGPRHHDVQQVRGQASEVRAGAGAAERALLRRVRPHARRRRGRPVGRVQPDGAQDHLPGPHGGQGLRHHGVGRLPARGHRARHAPCPLPHLVGAARRRRAPQGPLQGWRRPARLLQPRLCGRPRRDARGGGLPGSSRPRRVPPAGRRHRPQGRREAQEAQEGAAAVPALSGAAGSAGTGRDGAAARGSAHSPPRALKGLFQIKEIYFFFF